MVGLDHRDRARRPVQRPPSLPSASSPLLASTIRPSLLELRGGALDSASPEMSRIAGETRHAIFRFWDHTPNKRAAYHAPGWTSSCKALCHHHNRTCCSKTWAWLTPKEMRVPRLALNEGWRDQRSFRPNSFRLNSKRHRRSWFCDWQTAPVVAQPLPLLAGRCFPVRWEPVMFQNQLAAGRTCPIPILVLAELGSTGELFYADIDLIAAECGIVC
jgi:hypothetical protein